ncbi:BRISC complex subunit Abraxas 2-like [Glandiceps talaboti]
MASVNIAGSLWSSLILDHTNCPGDQEGFLIGEVTSHFTSTTTDTQERHKKEEVYINVYSYYPCVGLGSFYNSKGHVDQVKLLSMLKENYKHVIGWYKFRRMTPLDMSMRERALHQSLLNSLHGVSEQTFIFGLFTQYPNGCVTTHSMDCLCTVYNGSDFVPVPVNIINLGNTENSDYKLSSNSVINTSSGIYSKVLDSFREQFLDGKGQLHSVNAIQEMNTSMQSKLVSLRQNVGTSENNLQALFTEVKELRRKAEERRKQKKAEQKQKQEDQQVIEIREELEKQEIRETALPVEDFVPMETNAAAMENDDGPRNETPTEEEQEQAVPVASSDPFAGMISEMKDSIRKSRNTNFKKQGFSESSRLTGKQKSKQANSNVIDEGETKERHKKKDTERYERLMDDTDENSDSTHISNQSSNIDYEISNSPVF